MKHTQKYLLLKMASINSSVKELFQCNLVSFVPLGREWRNRCGYWFWLTISICQKKNNLPKLDFWSEHKQDEQWNAHTYINHSLDSWNTIGVVVAWFNSDRFDLSVLKMLLISVSWRGPEGSLWGSWRGTLDKGWEWQVSVNWSWGSGCYW